MIHLQYANVREHNPYKYNNNKLHRPSVQPCREKYPMKSGISTKAILPTLKCYDFQKKNTTRFPSHYRMIVYMYDMSILL